MKVGFREVVALDAAKLSKTPEGYLRAAPLVARTGIQVYKGYEFDRPQADEVRVYRPEAEVFSTDSLKSFTHIPVSNDHPPEMIDAKNWRKYAAGHSADEVARDGDRIRVPLVVMDGETVQAIERGKRELSMGYTMDLDWTAGKTPEGEAYDAIAKNIRCNHIAVVDTARGGPELRIGDQTPNRESVIRDREEERTMDKLLRQVTVDGLSVEMTDIAAQAFERYRGTMDKALADTRAELQASAAKIATLTADNAKLVTDHKVALDKKDGELETKNKELEDARKAADPATLDARVKDRGALIEKAKKILPNVTVDGKTDAEIRRQVVDSKLGTAAKDKSDDWIGVSFDTLQIAGGGQHTGRIIGTADTHSGQPNADAAEAAYDKMITDQENAWKGTPPAAH